MQAIPKPEHPRPDRMREPWLNLNGEWDFRLFEENGLEAEKTFAGQDGRIYDQVITVPFSWVSPLSGIQRDAAGVGWYRREAVFACEGRVFLCIGAADYYTSLYINGSHAGDHEGGYTPFETDVTDFWRMDKPNVVEVRCEDLRRSWQLRGKQEYGEIQGIWQTVWLESRPAVYIRHARITTRMDGRIDFDVLVSETDMAACAGILSASFDGVTVEAAVTLPPEDNRLRVAMRIPSPALWTPDTPVLYEGTLTLAANGISDCIHTYFGIREIEAIPYGDRSYPWILLNGKPVYINGVLDQAFHDTGHFTYPSDAAMQAEVWRLKRLGITLDRIHIKVEEPRKLYWMDKLGVMVMADIPCFWGDPTERAKKAYEAQWPLMILRDINHPCIIAFVLFNETWGLLTREEGDAKEYREDTQAWVMDVYRRAKRLDPSRLIEDNSPCRGDHTVTDINSWHFYLYGYEAVRDHVREVVKNTFPGSPYNHVVGRPQKAAPLLNSECGMVWGVDSSAGDSDLAWQYHYMLNEFRLYDKLCGFVFTEFHDVVNEFNGYYRIDDGDKDFGYEGFCRGMTIRDLHSPAFIAIDAPPCQTAEYGQTFTLPLVFSSFDGAYHGKQLTIRHELWYDGLDGRVTVQTGDMDMLAAGYGVHPPKPLRVTMPEENAVAVLSLYLLSPSGEVLGRNFTTFDVRGPRDDRHLEFSPAQGRAEGFALVWTAMRGEKACYGGCGQVSIRVDTSSMHWPEINGLTLFMEAGSKRILTKDRHAKDGDSHPLNVMSGRNTDRGNFVNSYYMTDESRHPSQVDVLIDGQWVDTLCLRNDYADARGVLSWHAQSTPRQLDEAGSYGEAQRVEIPSRLLPDVLQKGGFTLTLRVQDGGGLALYGRGSGRYPYGLLLRGW